MAHFYVARKNPGMLMLPGKRPVIIPGVTDKSEIRDLVQAILEKQGKDYHLTDKYLEQAELNREQRIHTNEAILELKRRQEGQLRRPVNKFIAPNVLEE